MGYRLDKTRDRLIQELVWRLPRRIVYWCAIRVGAEATTGQYGNTVVPELKYMDALKRWELEGKDNA